MKKTNIAIASALVLGLLSITALNAVEEGKKDGVAKIQSVHGDVQYLDNNVWVKARPNMKFGPGTTIKTGGNGMADIMVNGTTSAIRMTNSTTLQITGMSYVGTRREGDTTTMLNLLSGTVLGNVKKISANSRYEITTPHGVAGIRGTDFRVEVIPTQDGKFMVTFNSITGIITVSAVINGQTVTHTLQTGNQWTIGENPRQIAPEVVQQYQNQIMSMVQSMEPGFNGNGPGPGPGNNGPTQTPFPGGPPQGQSSS